MSCIHYTQLTHNLTTYRYLQRESFQSIKQAIWKKREGTEDPSQRAYHAQQLGQSFQGHIQCMFDNVLTKNFSATDRACADRSYAANPAALANGMTHCAVKIADELHEYISDVRNAKQLREDIISTVIITEEGPMAL
jgi:hypothetical protein